MKKILLTAAMAMVCAASQAASDGAPLWLRNTAISPDGNTIAFTFRGDIYTVPYTGGQATRLTTVDAYDSSPVWSPDGKQIAFSSNRNGSTDIFIVDANGGQPRRLTTHSGSETPLAFAGDKIIFTGNIMPSQKAINGYVFPQLYTVPVSGGRPELLLSLPAISLSVDNNGRILYTDKKGYEDKFRKHEQSSGTSDVWLVEGALSGKPVFRQLTHTPYHSVNPQWGGGNSFYYVSEADSTLNVYAASLDGTTPRQLTHFTKHPVRTLSVAQNGNMAFSQNGEIYTMTAGSEPVKLPVTIVADNGEQTEKPVAYTRTSRMALAPAGDEVALVVRGDIFTTPADYSTTRRITATPGQERTVSFSPDGRFMVYDSERDGRWQLYKAEIGKKDPSFTYAETITETPLNTGEGDAFQPVISPDGKKVAFLRNRTTLCVLDLQSGKTTVVMPGQYAYSYTDGDLSYSWHPDSEWILFNGYIGKGGWNNSDVAAISADGKEIVNLTESGYSDGNARWTPDGRGVLYESDRNGYRSHGSWGSQTDVFVMWLDPDAYEKFNRSKEDIALDETMEKMAKKEAKANDKKDSKGKGKKAKAEAKKEAKKAPLDFANRHDRRQLLTPNSSSLGDFWLNPKGDKLYYVTSFDDDGDLWVMDLKEQKPKMLKKGWGYGRLLPDSASKKLYTVANGAIKSYNLGSGDVKSIDFRAKSSLNAPAEREYMFDHMKSLVQNKFYDKNIHGIDWNGYTEEYGRFLPYINNRYDFAELLSEVLGELNASHTGGRAYGSSSPLTATAYLGAFFDPEYRGDGLRISEVIARGPLFNKKEIVPGTIITAIDGQPVKAGEDYFPLLAGKAGSKTRLSVTLPSGEQKTITVKPISQGANNALLRDRWVARNQAIVDSLSGGRIGYVSIQGMDSPSFREVYEQALGKYRNCDALIVDTRYNGGGWLHNDVALLLSGKKYVDYSPRGQYIGSDPFSQWTKPSVMLINECNYSDAHGTPYTYKTLGIGKLVGAPVPGTMTAVWWETQVDPSIIFGVPQVTSLDRNGKPLENQQLNPDILIYNQPADVLNGIDAQLAAAVKALLQK